MRLQRIGIISSLHSLAATLASVEALIAGRSLLYKIGTKAKENNEREETIADRALKKNSKNISNHFFSLFFTLFNSINHKKTDPQKNKIFLSLKCTRSNYYSSLIISL